MVKTVNQVSHGINGILIINKRAGMTSHDVVRSVRYKFHMQKIGHAGTLDPMATGVLVLLLGKATKLFNQFMSFDKAYKATLILGMKTTTADIQGKVIQQLPYQNFSKEEIENVLKKFLGETVQIPPMVSAIKINGKRLYELARKGIEVPRQPRKICINKIYLIALNLPRITFYLECSKGTYVRQLAEDIGEKLGSVACVEEIERTKVGPFDIENAVTLEELQESHVKRWLNL